MTIDLTAQIHQYLTTAPGSLFTQQQVAIVDHWEGDANLLWRVQVPGQEAVVKLFLDAGQARSRRQFDGHQLFTPAGLAPKPLWTDRYPHGLSRQLLVYAWSDGDPVTPDDPGELWAWAEAIGSLHTTPPDEVRRFSPHPINLDFYWRIEQGSIAQITQWLAPSGLALTPLFQRLAAATTQLVQTSLPLWTAAMPTPVHGDLTRDHTLVERGRITLLDWEMFGLGDPALDAARLLQREAQTLNPAQVETWLDRYLAVVDQPDMGARIEIFRRLLEAHNAIYLLVGLQQNRSGQPDDELIEALPFIQLALSKAIDRAATSLSLAESHDSASIVADFIVWLRQVTPAAS
ncbi:MAG: aminoglycoside phosphotransferase family protein [Caldilineaceae bacterium]|nr:aminoglycoside phosphotransferase family protein [Caldilineaceae bacterium]